MIAALYVQTGGAYFGLDGVDPWDEQRDARLYAGPHPVVAHPPCKRWGRYWFGGPSAKVRRTLGDDDGCFAAALAAVRRFGGVLEHPEASHAWRVFGLNAPPKSGGGFAPACSTTGGHVAWSRAHTGTVPAKPLGCMPSDASRLRWLGVVRPATLSASTQGSTQPKNGGGRFALAPASASVRYSGSRRQDRSAICCSAWRAASLLHACRTFSRTQCGDEWEACINGVRVMLWSPHSDLSPAVPRWSVTVGWLPRGAGRAGPSARAQPDVAGGVAWTLSPSSSSRISAPSAR